MVKILNKQSRSLKDQKNQLAQTGYGTRSRQDQGKHKSLLCKPRSQVEIGGQAFSHWPAEVTGTLKHGWNPCKVCFLTQERQVHSHPTTTPVLFQRTRHFLIFSLKQKYPVRKKKSPNKKNQNKGVVPRPCNSAASQTHTTVICLFSAGASPPHPPPPSFHLQIDMPFKIYLLALPTASSAFKISCDKRWVNPGTMNTAEPSGWGVLQTSHMLQYFVPKNSANPFSNGAGL